MRKRTILLLLALMPVLNSFAEVNDTVYVSSVNYTIISKSDRTVAVTSPQQYIQINDTIRYFEYGGDIVIPSTVFIDTIEYRVTAIGSWAFADQSEIGNTELTSITIPEGITRIGTGAFAGCTGLTSLYIPASVTCIEERVIAGCKLDSIKVALGNAIYDSRDSCNAIIETESNTLIAGCTNTIIPESVTGIGEYAFESCRGLTSIVLPDKLRSIGNRAFYCCKNLVSINIPESVDSIGYGILGICPDLSSITVDINNPVYDSRDNCNAIIKTKTSDLIAGCNNTIIPSGVTTIVQEAFEGSGITSIVIPDGVTEILSGAFYYCTNLVSVELPTGVTSIGSSAFQDCSNLASINLPSSLTYIGDRAFQDCSNLDSIELPSSLMHIGWAAFENCSNISSITIPKGIKEIGSRSFYNCVGLTSITILFESTNPERFFNPILSGINYDSCSLYVPEGCFIAYQNVFGNFYRRNLDNVHILKNPDCITIDGINYCIVSPDDKTVRVVHGDYAGDVVIPSSVKIDGTDYSVVSISNEAFANCNQLASVFINEGVTSIGEYSFYDCDSLMSAILPLSVKVINKNAFNNCRSLSSFTIPQGIKTIEFDLFRGCIALKHIDIPSSVDSIGVGAFSGCRALETINIPDNIKIINGSTFSGCTSLKSISIPSGVDSIGNCAFSDCKLLESIIVPEGVRTISNGTFMGCESLSYLSLPASVKVFGKNVFDDCYALKSAGPKGGGFNYEFSWTDTIPGSAFNGLKSLRSVCVPKYIRLLNDQGIDFGYYDVIDNYGTKRMLYKAWYFNGCDSLESLAISFSDTKIMRKIDPLIRYRYPDYADYYLFIGTPIHSITFIDDTIKGSGVLDYGKIDEVVISKHVKNVNPRLFNRTRYVKTIEVEEVNDNYSSRNGILFNKSGDELLAYPSAREDANYTLPSGVVKIGNYAFYKSENLSSVTIPEDVEIIGEGAFEDCQSLESVKITGSPIISHNAFLNCTNIETVRSWSATPGNMQQYDTPQPIMVGADDYDKDGMIITKEYNQEIGRFFYKIRKMYYDSWSYDIISTDIPAGQYKVSIGILPNETDSLPNYINPVIKGITDSIDVVLFDSIITDTIIDSRGRKRAVRYEYYITNDISSYDTILITDTLTIPQGLEGVKITLTSGVNERNFEKFTPQLWLDRIFFEPLDKDQPEERYAGPFAESVFNNATLLVPEGAASTYKSADGWRLFKNIQVDTAVKSAYQDRQDKITADAVIYDLLGRRVKADRVEMLPPGLYIVNGRKYLVK